MAMKSRKMQRNNRLWSILEVVQLFGVQRAFTAVVTTILSSELQQLWLASSVQIGVIDWILIELCMAHPSTSEPRWLIWAPTLRPTRRFSISGPMGTVYHVIVFSIRYRPNIKKIPPCLDTQFVSSPLYKTSSQRRNSRQWKRTRQPTELGRANGADGNTSNIRLNGLTNEEWQLCQQT